MIAYNEEIDRLVEEGIVTNIESIVAVEEIPISIEPPDTAMPTVAKSTTAPTQNTANPTNAAVTAAPSAAANTVSPTAPGSTQVTTTFTPTAATAATVVPTPAA